MRTKKEAAAAETSQAGLGWALSGGGGGRGTAAPSPQGPAASGRNGWRWPEGVSGCREGALSDRFGLLRLGLGGG